MSEKELTSHWIAELTGRLLLFPKNFTNGEDSASIPLPGKALVIGNEFFGAYEILTVDGTSFMQAEDYTTAKFIVYANRLKPASVLLPKDKRSLSEAVEAYEKYIDSLVKQITADYNKQIPGGKGALTVINDIFRSLNLTRY